MKLHWFQEAPIMATVAVMGHQEAVEATVEEMEAIQEVDTQEAVDMEDTLEVVEASEEVTEVVHQVEMDLEVL